MTVDDNCDPLFDDVDDDVDLRYSNLQVISILNEFCSDFVGDWIAHEETEEEKEIESYRQIAQASKLEIEDDSG